MKKILLFALMLCASTTFATVRTVNNMGGAQFFDLESAIVAASSGDTIYIHGTPGYYCHPSTYKDNITWIGPGFNPSKQSPYVAYVDCDFWVVGNNNTFIGLNIDRLSGYNSSGWDYLNGLTVKRCRLYNFSGNQCGNLSISNVIFEDCIFEGAGSALGSNCGFTRNVSFAIFRNCLFYNESIFGAFDYCQNIIVDHCLFYNNSGYNNYICGNIPANGQVAFTNNIFYNTYGASPGLNFTTYVNNFSTTQNLNLVNGGSGNIMGANPMFVNAAGGALSYSHDYHLASGSPCIGTGTGGTDMGIYSGVAPFIWEGHPPIPQMDYFNIIGTQAPQGGSINVTFQSTIKN